MFEDSCGLSRKAFRTGRFLTGFNNLRRNRSADWKVTWTPHKQASPGPGFPAASQWYSLWVKADLSLNFRPWLKLEESVSCHSSFR